MLITTSLRREGEYRRRGPQKAQGPCAGREHKSGALAANRSVLRAFCAGFVENLGDPASAQDFVAMIKNRRLSRRDGALRCYELDTSLGAVASRHLRRGCDVLVPNLHTGFNGFARGRGANPINIADQEAAMKQLGIAADHDAIMSAVDA